MVIKDLRGQTDGRPTRNSQRNCVYSYGKPLALSMLESWKEEFDISNVFSLQLISLSDRCQGIETKVLKK